MEYEEDLNALPDDPMFSWCGKSGSDRITLLAVFLAGAEGTCFRWAIANGRVLASRRD